jgi:large subunit ribosomal protein L24
MKFKVKDKVIVTIGKDKGKTGEITKILPKDNKVVVGGLNLYTKHIKKKQGQAGEIVKLERPFALSKIAIINDKGTKDRIGYVVKSGKKQRIFKKTKKIIEEKK